MMRSSLLFFILWATGCTLYESGGHEAIQKNTGNIVTYSGMDQSLRFYYQCSLSASQPDFLKEPLEVIDSGNLNSDFAAYISQATPRYIALHRLNEQNKTHSSCRVDFVSTTDLPSQELLNAAYQVAIEHFASVTPRQSSSLQ